LQNGITGRFYAIRSALFNRTGRHCLAHPAGSVEIFYQMRG
jgi:hypothetical protein